MSLEQSKTSEYRTDPYAPVQPGAGHRWYADIPLSETNATAVAVSFQDGYKTVPVSIAWQPINLLENELESPYLIRSGDSLRFTAAPAGATNGTVDIAIDGETAYQTVPGAPATLAFTNAGNYTVTGTYSGGGTSATGSLDVAVMDAEFPEEEPGTWLDMPPRAWKCPDIPLDVWLESDRYTELERAGAYEGGSMLEVALHEVDDDHHVVARLAEGAPILASKRLAGFWYDRRWNGTAKVIEYLEDGSRVIEDTIKVGYFPSYAYMVYEIFAGGGVLEDGSTTMTIYPEDLDENGEFTVRMIVPPDGAACSRVHIYNSVEYTGTDKEDTNPCEDKEDPECVKNASIEITGIVWSNRTESGTWIAENPYGGYDNIVCTSMTTRAEAKVEVDGSQYMIKYHCEPDENVYVDCGVPDFIVDWTFEGNPISGSGWDNHTGTWRAVTGDYSPTCTGTGNVEFVARITDDNCPSEISCCTNTAGYGPVTTNSPYAAIGFQIAGPRELCSNCSTSSTAACSGDYVLTNEFMAGSGVIWTSAPCALNDAWISSSTDTSAVFNAGTTGNVYTITATSDILTNCSASIDVNVYDLHFIGSDGNVADELCISKWPSAFSGTNAVFDSNFISADTNRFTLQLTGVSSNAGPVTVKLSIDSPESSWDDSETEAILYEKSTGIYTSKTMILVSNEIDDNETHDGADGAISGCSDNASNDRTHIAIPGATVEAKFTIAPSNDCITTASVPLDGTVYLEMVVPVVENTPIISSSQVALHTHVLTETFAQVGLKTHAYITHIDLPSNVNLDDGLIILAPDAYGTNWVHQETRDLISAGGTVPDTSDIHFFYTLEMFWNTYAGTPTAGMQINPSQDIAPSHMKYTYNAFISTWDHISEDIFLPFCPAHELVHLLGAEGDEHRYDQPWNLMDDAAVCHALDDISNPKRLDQDHESAIKSDNIHITQ